MALLGSHLSIAGGYYKAVRTAAELSLDCVQLFTKNNNRWDGKPLSPADIDQFASAMAETGIAHPISHASYLINLAAADDFLWNRSIEAMAVELERAFALGIPHVIVHPGAHVGSGEEVGLARIACGIVRVLQRTEHLPTTIALETTAGQGTCLGHRFEHLAYLLDATNRPARLTVCLDTCHVHAAGYALHLADAYEETWSAFDRLIGLDRLVAIHLNDSKKPFASRVDRHEHIGRGHVGREAFQRLMNDARLAGIPMYLETPKGTDAETGLPWDTVNTTLLRELAAVTPK